MKLSRLGEQMTADCGIVSLMDDLGHALHVNPDMVMMGGGNPAFIPAAADIFQARLKALAESPTQAKKLLAEYQSPQGSPAFLKTVAQYLRDRFQWPVTAEHIAIANGSQSAFFVLFNLFCGETSDGSFRRVQLPLAPEYIGYADAGLAPDFFRAAKPTITELSDQLFKYHVDFSALNVDESIGALCLSRPTNPTGNMVSDAELAHLDELARAKDVPLIIDGAYGTPFPNIVFSQASPHWNDNTILLLSLSKLGLPGLRTGIVVARPEVIRAFVKANTIMNLAVGSAGTEFSTPFFADGTIDYLSETILRPFYRSACDRALDGFRRALADYPVRIHKPEGAFFLWLWFKDLPISSQALYQRLKNRGVLVLAGEQFFMGLDEPWQHKQECLRVSYCLPPEQLAKGVALIAEEVARVYAGD